MSARGFDEVDDYIWYADDARWTLPNGNWAMAYWVDIGDNTGSQFQYWYSQAPDGNPFASPSINVWVNELSQASPGAIKLDIIDAGGDEAFAEGSTGDMSPDTWHSVVCQREGNAFNAYVDNVLKATATNAAVGEINVGENVDFGRRSDADSVRFFGGSLGPFAKWDRALSSGERAHLRRGGHPRRLAGCKLYIVFGGFPNEPEFMGSGLTGTITGTTVVAGPPIQPPFGLRRRTIVVVSGLAPVVVGIASETSSAFGVTARRTHGVGLSAEADTGLATTSAKAKALGLSAEADAAFGLTSAKSLATSLGVETDTAFGLTSAKLRSVGLSSEAASALGVTAARRWAVGLSSEADSALAILAAKLRGVGLAGETDSALAVTLHRLYAIGLAAEADSAFPVTTGETIVVVGLSTEADSAFGLSSLKTQTLGLSLETDAGLAITPLRLYSIGLPSETDLALAVDYGRAFNVGLASESDLALALTIRRIYAIGLATETDSAFGALPFFPGRLALIVAITGAQRYLVLSDSVPAYGGVLQSDPRFGALTDSAAALEAALRSEARDEVKT
jgi:hypothetical protein